MGRGRNGGGRRGRIVAARVTFQQPRYFSGNQFVMNPGVTVLPIGSIEKTKLNERTLATVTRVDVDSPRGTGYFVEYQRNNRFERGFVYEADLT